MNGKMSSSINPFHLSRLVHVNQHQALQLWYDLLYCMGLGLKRSHSPINCVKRQRGYICSPTWKQITLTRFSCIRHATTVRGTEKTLNQGWCSAVASHFRHHGRRA